MIYNYIRFRCWRPPPSGIHLYHPGISIRPLRYTAPRLVGAVWREVGPADGAGQVTRGSVSY